VELSSDLVTEPAGRDFIMPRVSYAFFFTSAVCGLFGMVWGLWMGASQDHATFPAHAHLNLLGWLGLAMMGTFHALQGGARPRLAWINFALSSAGALLMPAGIALIVKGRPGAEPLAILGGVLALAGAATFLVAVVRGWIGAGEPVATSPAYAPAE
jgi:hypothetical protein